MAAAVLRLLDDPDLRGRLVEEGLRTAATMDWDTATDSFLHALESAAADR